MNKIESFVYNIVKNNYILKNLVRNTYQGLYDLMPNYDSSFCSTPIELPNSFFGFHDCNPFDKDATKHLAYKLNIPLRMPDKEDLLEYTAVNLMHVPTDCDQQEPIEKEDNGFYMGRTR